MSYDQQKPQTPTIRDRHLAPWRAQDPCGGCCGGPRACRCGARYAQAQSSEPIKIGFQVHRTGIGAAYGRWYDRTTQAAVKLINEGGGINGRPVEIVAEDDGTDPKRVPKWWRNSPRSIIATSVLARCFPTLSSARPRVLAN